MFTDFNSHVKNGDIKEVKRLLSTKAVDISGEDGLHPVIIAIYNHQEHIFGELLKYFKNIYTNKMRGEVTLLHVLISRLSFSPEDSDEANKFYNMIRILLIIEAKRRIREPNNHQPFLEQIPDNSGYIPIQLIKHRVFDRTRSEVSKILDAIEKKYPAIVNLKAQAEAKINGYELVGEGSSITSSSTLRHRHSASSDENIPLLTQTESAEQINSWRDLWNKLSAFITGSEGEDGYRSPTMKSR